MIRAAILCILFLFLIPEASARDIISWRNIELDTNYNIEKEELELQVSLYVSKKPESLYDIKIELGEGNICSIPLEYSSFHLRGSCSVYINPVNIREKYETKMLVHDEFKNEVLDRFIQIDVTDVPEAVIWEDMGVVAAYNDEREKMKLVLYFDDVRRVPDEEFDIEFFLEGKKFKKTLELDRDKMRLFTQIEVSSEDRALRRDFTLPFDVYDEKGERVHDGRGKFRPILVVEDSHLIWERLRLESRYEEKGEKLFLNISLGGIASKPQKNYTLSLELDDKTYTENFIYNADLKSLKVEIKISVSEDDISRVIRPDLEIKDNYGNTVLKQDDTYKVDFLYKDDKFDWSKIDVLLSYNQRSELLDLSVVLRDIPFIPQSHYIGEIEILGKDYVDNFIYNEEEKSLVFHFKERVKKEDIKDRYHIEVDIENDLNKRVLREDFILPVSQYNDSSESVNDQNLHIVPILEWNDVELKLNYNSKTQYLHANFIANSIPDYFQDAKVKAFVFIEEIEEERNVWLKYNANAQIFSGQLNYFIRKEKVAESYKLSLLIENEFKENLYEHTNIYLVEFDTKRDKNEKRKVESKLQGKIEQFVRNVYRKHNKPQDAKSELRLIIRSLDDYGNRKTKYRLVIDDVIGVIERMIEEVD